MKIFVQILGTSTVDSTPSVLLFLDKKRYVFNCGEGTQRFCSEYKIRLSKTKFFFFTRLSWHHIGGLPGNILTVSDEGVSGLEVYGPSNLLNLIKSTRYFVSRNEFSLKVKEYRSIQCHITDVFQDEFIQIRPILICKQIQNVVGNNGHNNLQPLEDNAFKKDQYDCEHQFALGTGMAIEPTVSDQGEDRDGECYIQLKQENTRNCNSELARKMADSSKLISETKPVDSIVCYACHLPTIPGKFDPEAADRLGVPKNQRWVLAQNKPLLIKENVTVYPSQCVGPEIPGRVVIIVECPNENYMNNLVRHDAFKIYQTNGNEQGEFYYQVALMIHMVPNLILTNKRYTEWMKSFNLNVEHIIINADCCKKPIIFRSSALYQAKLYALRPDIFQLPASSESTDVLWMESGQFPQRMTVAQPLLKVMLGSQSVKIDDSLCFKDCTPFCDSVNSDTINLGSDSKTQSSSIQGQGPFSSDPFEVVFLGTGAALPSKYRNVSSTLVHIFGFGCLLLDSGEGTLGQLYRHYGSDYKQILAKIKCIFISHMHADHHLGLIRIVLARQECGEVEPIVVIGPPQYNLFLMEYNQVESFSYEFINAYDFSWNEKMGAKPCHDTLKKLETMLGITAILSILAIHCDSAFSFVIEYKKKWKIVFSGDTRPNPVLNKAGQGCQLLIHEATFEDELIQEAVKKKHSTVSEAVSSGIEMKAEYLIMTHFSQRYPKIPILAQEGQEKIGIAFDLMKVRMSTIACLPGLLSELRRIFEEDAENGKKRPKNCQCKQECIESAKKKIFR
ncbi:uncharacterized protein LOC126319882 [Schistocerca gregaria]|uniref:uncharacterized protein LOC126319882 n=1 Tax=Schistocerca gregaria TaxID=7010 RepID=UPI00211E65EB|nr:uncharacterized protein LOC126319882 [Schistocerca gregaria]